MRTNGWIRRSRRGGAWPRSSPRAPSCWRWSAPARSARPSGRQPGRHRRRRLHAAQAAREATRRSITLSARSTIATADGTHLPALEELDPRVRQAHRRLHQGPADLHIGQLRNTVTQQAKSICGDALVGNGKAGRRNRIPRTGTLLSAGAAADLQRRAEGGHPVLIFHAYAYVPAPTTFVTTAVLGRAIGHLRDQGPDHDPDDRRRPGLAQLRRTLDPQKLEIQRQGTGPCSWGPARPGTSSCAATSSSTTASGWPASWSAAAPRTRRLTGGSQPQAPLARASSSAAASSPK